jgi:hypothetical protein
MSSAWIKQLLLDYGLNRLSIDQKSDIVSAIDGLIKARVLSYNDLQILNLYISGYTATEIANMHIQSSTARIEAILTRVVMAIGTGSGYTDDQLVQRAKQHQIRTKMPKFITFLQQHSTTFTEHDV